MNKIDHSISQTDLPLDVQILNISVNLSRLSKWVYDGYEEKEELINRFLKQTESYLNDLDTQKISAEFKPTLERFKKEFTILKGSVKDQDKRNWAEKALTWANILQHRAKLV